MNYDNLFAVFKTCSEPKPKPLPKLQDQSSNSQVKITSPNTPIKSYSYHEDKNLKYRQAMEDMSSQTPDLLSNYEYNLFGIYDGHGGTDVVKFIKDRFPEIFKKTLLQNPQQNSQKNIMDMFTTIFSKVDGELKFFDSDNIGSTATLVLVNKNNLYCGNVGDSRGYIVTKNKALQITVDHKCSNPDEEKRIVSNGGKVEKGRVNGQLVLSRSLGDMNCKKFGVISEPSVSHVKLDDSIYYCVIASDGVWDAVDDKLLYDLSAGINGDSDKYCKLIVDTAINKGSKDNISCIVISFI